MFGYKAYKELNIYDRFYAMILRKTGLFIATVIDANISQKEINHEPIFEIREVQIVYFQLTDDEKEICQKHDQDQYEDLIKKDFTQQIINQTFYPNNDSDIANHFTCKKMIFINFEIVNKKLNIFISQKYNQENDINIEMITLNKEFIRKVIQKLNTFMPLKEQN
eukprot:403342034